MSESYLKTSPVKWPTAGSSRDAISTVCSRLHTIGQEKERRNDVTKEEKLLGTSTEDAVRKSAPNHLYIIKWYEGVIQEGQKEIGFIFVDGMG
jgi:hypothetical protein